MPGCKNPEEGPQGACPIHLSLHGTFRKGVRIQAEGEMTLGLATRCLTHC